VSLHFCAMLTYYHFTLLLGSKVFDSCARYRAAGVYSVWLRRLVIEVAVRQTFGVLAIQPSEGNVRQWQQPTAGGRWHEQLCCCPYPGPDPGSNRGERWLEAAGGGAHGGGPASPHEARASGGRDDRPAAPGHGWILHRARCAGSAAGFAQSDTSPIPKCAMCTRSPRARTAAGTTVFPDCVH
jgi:hypothetical protein